MTQILHQNYSTTNFNNNNKSPYRYSYSVDELHVAHILLDLPNLFQPYNTKHSYNNFIDSIYDDGFPNWVSKKRRSVLDTPPTPPPPKRRRVCYGNPSKNYPPAKAVVVKLLPEVKSPSSPLTFSPTQPHCILKNNNTSFKRKTKLNSEALRSILLDEMKTNQDLQESIKKVKCHLEELRSENSSLKAQKLQFLERMGMVKRENNNQQEEAVTSSSTANDHLLDAPSSSTQLPRSPPLVLGRRGGILDHPAQQNQQIVLYDQAQPDPQPDPQPAPRGFFDLNLAPDEEDMMMVEDVVDNSVQNEQRGDDVVDNVAQNEQRGEDVVDNGVQNEQQVVEKGVQNEQRDVENGVQTEQRKDNNNNNNNSGAAVVVSHRERAKYSRYVRKLINKSKQQQRQHRQRQLQLQAQQVSLTT